MLICLTPHLLVKYKDILISTVRTYRKGIAFVDRKIDNMTCTSAILVLGDVDESLTKEYIFAVLKTDFFVEQILSFQNRGMYPRLDNDTIDYLYIPLPRNKKELDYITKLQEMFFKKHEQIQIKSGAIVSLIKAQIGYDSAKNSTYSHPLVSDLINVGRLDTGPYTSSYKNLDSKIKNYKTGFKFLEELGYSINRGQNLQVSNIGRSVYSEKEEDGFYKLILSKYLTDKMTVEGYEYLGNTKKLKTIEKGDIIFSCRGDLGRVFVSCEDMPDTITNIDNVHIKNEKTTLENKIFIGAFLNYLREEGYLSSISIQGSGADSFTKYHFDLIKIPNFDKSIQEEIAKLYFNKDLSVNSKIEFDNFNQLDKEWNERAGIYQIDKSLKLLKNKLKEVVDNIIFDREQNFNFTFYN